MAIDVHIATRDDIERVAASMPDMSDFEAAGIDEPILDIMLREAEVTRLWCAKVDGDPIAIYGVSKSDWGILSEIGTAWLVPTKLIERRDVIKAMLKYGRKEIERISVNVKTLAGLKLASDTKSIRWLKMLGFDIDNEPFYYNNNRFVRVVMKLEK